MGHRVIKIVLLIILLITLQPSDSNRIWRVETEDFTKNWKLGDDIRPLPEYGDCDDKTLYSYNYILAFPYNYQVKIMAGYPMFSRGYHVWLVASDETTKYIYDNGVALSNRMSFAFLGKEISYATLLEYALYDERSMYEPLR